MNSHPFASIAFLSGLAPSGASLSASLWPAPPRSPAGLWPGPLQTGGLWPGPLNVCAPPAWLGGAQGLAAQWPTPPDGLSAQWPSPPDSLSAQWPVPPKRSRPEDGTMMQLPPAADERSLMAQALRQSRARIVRAADGDDEDLGTAPPALWRWAPDSRVKSVVCELVQRFWIDDRTLYVLDGKPSGKGSGISARAIYKLPPKLTPAEMDEQIDKVLRAAVERDDRMPEILAQAQDIWPFYESITGIHLERAPRLAELMAVAQESAVHLVMLLKHRMAMKRPVEASSRVLPMIATPGHGSLPSGHATLAALTSELLHILMYDSPPQPQRSEHLDRLARRIAFNRVVAGVHFPVDSQAGYALGTLLARWFAALAEARQLPPVAAKGSDIAGGSFELPEVPAGAQAGRPAYAEDDQPATRADALKTLWRKASRELDEIRV